MEEQELTIIGSGTAFVPRMYSFDKTPEYPSQTFQKLQGKPPITVYKTERDAATLRARAYEYILGSSVSMHCVIEYLHLALGQMKGSLPQEWKSYGNVIGKDDITPLHLLNVTVLNKTYEFTIGSPKALTEADDLYLMLFLFGLYRFGITHEKQKTTYSEKVEGILRGVTVQAGLVTSVQNGKAHAIDLTSSTEFRMMAAAVDMFLLRFPDHAYARLRAGTVILKHEGFSAYSGIQYFNKRLGGVQIYKTLEWIFIPSLAEELKQIFVTHFNDEEFKDEYSYLPYMMGFRLSAKSPYSAASNPGLHALIHVVGTLFGAQRSRNALMPQDIAPVPLAINAGIIFIAHRKSATLRKVVALTSKAEALETAAQNMDKMEGDLELSDELPKTPDEWIAHFQDLDFQFPRSYAAQIQKAIDGIIDPREGSVAAWVQANFMVLLNVQDERD